MAPSVRAKVGISPSVPAPVQQLGVDKSPPIKSSQVGSEGRRAAPFVRLGVLMLVRVPPPALQYLVFLPLLAVVLVGAGLITNRSWLFSIGFGLLLASVALLITLRRRGPR